MGQTDLSLDFCVDSNIGQLCVERQFQIDKKKKSYYGYVKLLKNKILVRGGCDKIGSLLYVAKLSF